MPFLPEEKTFSKVILSRQEKEKRQGATIFDRISKWNFDPWGLESFVGKNRLLHS